MARVFNAVAAMGICASLAMLGWQLQAERPSETRYNFSVVVPPSDKDSDDDADMPPSANDRQGGSHNSRSGDQSDDDERAGHPIGQPDSNAAIPI
jgi:hypothetical protein